MTAPDTPATLGLALAGRYAIEKEVGRGGMATVYVAQDVKHERRVAIKVLRPELAAALGAERFIREIKITAGLQHPHILPLFDSGEAAGLLYYVTPFVAGESLLDRGRRGPPLDLDEAIRIGAEVASALAYAHARGVVHRDIKPANILLSDGHALVADFGIARAVEAAGRDSLTGTGMALGTPAYMSPEQAAGDPTLDGRSDIYSLGCLLYEMLTGRVAFTGEQGEVLLARRFTEPPPRARALRPQIPVAIDDAIAKAMAADPAARYGDASAFARALSLPVGQTSVARARPAPLAYVLGGAALVAALAGAAVWRAFGHMHPPPPNGIAVLPFRLGVDDPALRYMGEGMMDLLENRLSGDAGVLPVPARSVMSVWRRTAPSREGEIAPDEALRIARSAGWEQVVLGSIVGTTTRVEITASLLSVPTGRVRASAKARGSADNVQELADTIAAELLSREAGEEAQRLPVLRHVSLAALKPYLAAHATYRRGRYAEAVAKYEEALDIDSTFGLAALGFIVASNYVTVANDAAEHALRVAWQQRDHFSSRDQAYLKGRAGRHYPALSSMVDQIEDWNQAVQAAPDRAEAWYELGDRLMAFGQSVGLADPVQRAANAFEHALARDSSFTPPMERLAELYARSGDTARAHHFESLLLATDSSADRVGYVQWRVAMSRADTTAANRLRARFSRLPLPTLATIWTASLLDGMSLADAERAVQLSEQRATTADERADASVARYLLEMNKGHPHAALPYLRRSAGSRTYLVPVMQAQIVRDAIFGGGDSTAAREAVLQLTRTIAELTDPTPADRAVLYVALCATAQWRLAHRDTTDVSRVIARVRVLADSVSGLRIGGATTPIVGDDPVCPAALDAMRAHQGSRSDAGAALAHLDSLARRGPADVEAPVLDLLLARLHEARGEGSAALAAVRGRPYAASSIFFLADYLREEGRLAAATGDRDGAIRAYRRYLELRSDPESSLRAEADAARTALRMLERTERPLAELTSMPPEEPSLTGGHDDD